LNSEDAAEDENSRSHLAPRRLPSLASPNMNFSLEAGLGKVAYLMKTAAHLQIPSRNLLLVFCCVHVGVFFQSPVSPCGLQRKQKRKPEGNVCFWLPWLEFRTHFPSGLDDIEIDLLV
jgi:hypothetical protein